MTQREEEEDLEEAILIIADMLRRGGNYHILVDQVARTAIVRAIIGRRYMRKQIEVGANVGIIGELAIELAAIGFPPIRHAPFGTKPR